MRDGDSVWTMETTIPPRKPSVTKRCSSYAKRSSSKVKVGPSNTLGASTKSKPCSFRFRRRFLSSQENRMRPLYIHGVYASTESGGREAHPRQVQRIRQPGNAHEAHHRQGEHGRPRHLPQPGNPAHGEHALRGEPGREERG